MVIHIPYKRTHTEPETRDSTHSRHTVRHLDAYWQLKMSPKWEEEWGVIAAESPWHGHRLQLDLHYRTMQ